MNVLYDVGNLGLAFGTALTRSGIFRVTESFAMEAMAHPDIRARFTATDSYVSEIQLARYDRSKGGTMGDRRLFAWSSGGTSLDESMTLLDRLFDAGDDAPGAARLRAEVGLLNRMARPAPIHGEFDVYHSLRQPLVDRGRVVARARMVLLHDMIPSLFPNVTEERFISLHDAVLRSIDFERDWMMCCAESTRRDISEVTGMAPDRIFVVPLAASSRIFRPAEDPALLRSVRDRYGIGSNRYILSVCTLEPRKNLTRLVSAFAALTAIPELKDVRLVLVGALGWKAGPLLEKIRTLALPEERLLMTGHVPDEDLGPLLTGAAVFAYPSLYEGFGLPVLEAMQCGTPVVTSRTSSLPEVVGDAAITIEPTDEDALAQALMDVLQRSELAESLRHRGMERARAFTWRRTVDQTVDAYRTMLSRSG